jgi:hypothetical protein
MSDWIDLSALWKIIVVSLLCGAGLPAVFAIGLRLLDFGDTRRGDDTSDAVVATRNPVMIAAAALCFAVVLGAIGWGIYLIVAGT